MTREAVSYNSTDNDKNGDVSTSDSGQEDQLVEDTVGNAFVKVS